MSNGQQIEVLLIENNPNDIELVLRAFKKHNLHNLVHVVRDGAAALDFVFCTGAYKDREMQKTPKVIILDLKLPKVSGKEVLKRIKSDERTRTIPVVVTTSSREARDVVESYRLGVNSYIVKPVDFQKFVDTIADLGLYWLIINKPPVA